ncbi:Rieske (2Fe-2S) protein [Tenggerimyces flavus]|uniref:Cytochrome bc1 complex Rieske iron-sulfur subunit n=1 Tax=Tenggerimyces flavus TaxID=1708749 RepID=A0ABV7YGF2_9ACTN|nr:Rieske (2Fe-2S) protein [Tenggerimyces flavus]MBM7787274.1 Rieske Fe-S protein [Tenggerimyces flavus]
MTLDPQNPMTRRRILSGVVVAGAAAPILAACGSGEDPESAPTTSADPTAAASDPAPAPSDSASSEPPAPDDSPSAEESAGTGGEAVAKTADVPVGGGTVNKQAHVVVVQPAAGEYKAYTSICTHRGCDVSKVDGGTINCECHGSKFKIEDGSVANGPATAPLDAIAVTVSGADVVKA